MLWLQRRRASTTARLPLRDMDVPVERGRSIYSVIAALGGVATVKNSQPSECTSL
jgi:hypothetical protein